ncbi:type II secretion system F family protein [Acetobacter oeni]|uniref:type II secretion system F family protein n=1 Tax=Acetobacter oeni TaxID=304077 RepID=UPI0011BF3EC8|nr:type II secretion system F family protein [Acetobacter oeni]MBB3881899.1 tight adherence protein C [Acetobacter oeni]NHO17778.1 hypothetical protein [Acetobacter oeni]
MALILIILSCVVLVWEFDRYLTELRIRQIRLSKICSQNNYRSGDAELQKTLFSRIFSKIRSELSRSKVLQNAINTSALKNGNLKYIGVDAETFILMKIMLCILAAGAGYFYACMANRQGLSMLLETGIPGVFGLLAPDFVMKQRANMHLRRVDAGMADALDLFLVCAEAGLGMETSMERVAAEMVTLNRDVAYEFRKTVDELRVNSDRYKVIEDLGKRTGVEGLLRLSAALAQTLETGASLGAVLRVLVAEIREDTLIKFESKAAKLSVFLTFPMIIFLLPCMFIVIAGPAIINVIAALSR